MDDGQGSYVHAAHGHVGHVHVAVAHVAVIHFRVIHEAEMLLVKEGWEM